jgi:hypothetical protein
MSSSRRFPPPWTLEENNDACFIVRDKNGQALGYFYFEEEPQRQMSMQRLSRDEARAFRRRRGKNAHMLQPGCLQDRCFPVRSVLM